MTEPITNEQGYIALKYYQPMDVLAMDTPTKTDYKFNVRANLSIAYVNPDDVDNMLSRKAGCNCGGSKKKQAYRYASEDEIRRWTNGGGR